MIKQILKLARRFSVEKLIVSVLMNKLIQTGYKQSHYLCVPLVDLSLHKPFKSPVPSPLVSWYDLG